MSRKYKFRNPANAYFVSFATVKWTNVFNNEIYLKILADSVDYCRKHKGMILNAYVFMPNHVHFVFRSANEDPTGLLRDFKGFTSRKILKAIEENADEPNREFWLKRFEHAGLTRSNVKKYQFWQQDNQQVEVYSSWIINQKINYIHRNPVKAGLIENATEWKYSSARNYAGDQSILEIDLL